MWGGVTRISNRHDNATRTDARTKKQQHERKTPLLLNMAGLMCYCHFDPPQMATSNEWHSQCAYPRCTSRSTFHRCLRCFDVVHLRALMSPIFGRMSTKHGYRRALMISTLMVVFGAMAYTIAASTFAVFVSQVLLGEGFPDTAVSSGLVFCCLSITIAS